MIQVIAGMAHVANIEAIITEINKASEVLLKHPNNQEAKDKLMFFSQMYLAKVWIDADGLVKVLSEIQRTTDLNKLFTNKGN